MDADHADETGSSAAVEAVKHVLESIGVAHPAAEAVRATLVADHLEDFAERKMTKARIDRLAEDLAARVEEAAG